jgi:hypothetical protein
VESANNVWLTEFEFIFDSGFTGFLGLPTLDALNASGLYRTLDGHRLVSGHPRAMATSFNAVIENL